MITMKQNKQLKERIKRMKRQQTEIKEGLKMARIMIEKASFRLNWCEQKLYDMEIERDRK